MNDVLIELCSSGPLRRGQFAVRLESDYLRSVRHMLRRMLPGPVRLLSLVCLILFVGVGNSWAHAQLVSTVPAANMVLEDAPEALRLTFTEPVEPARIKWFSPDGQEHQITDFETAGATVLIPSAAAAARDLSPGTHLISYRVTSSDGHVVAGSFAFSLGETSTLPLRNDNRNLPARLAAIGRFILTVSLTLSAGGAAFFALIVRGSVLPAWPRRLGAVSGVIAVVAVPFNFGLQGLDLLGGGGAQLLTLEPYVVGLRSSFAPTGWLALAAGLLACGALTGSYSTFRMRLGIAAWLVAAVSFATFGHAASAAPQVLMRPALAVHSAAFLYWLGSLPGLLAVALARPSFMEKLLARFSQVAVPAIVLLFASGIAISVVQVADPAYLKTTDYGLVLIVKFALVLTLVSLAAVNKIVLTPRTVDGDTRATRLLGMSIRAELLLAVAILVAASTFRVTPPPRALAAADRSGASVHIHQTDAYANVSAYPGRRGDNRAVLEIAESDADPINAKEVLVSFSQPARGVEPIRVRATKREDGLWVAKPLPLTVAGHWDVVIDALVTDFEQIRLRGVLEIRP